MDKFASVATAAALLARPAPSTPTALNRVPKAPSTDPQLPKREQLQRLEERMDDMQNNILCTQQMIRDLSTLVHRQIKLSTARNKTRNSSENFSSPNFQMFPTGPPIDSLPHAASNFEHESPRLDEMRIASEPEQSIKDSGGGDTTLAGTEALSAPNKSMSTNFGTMVQTDNNETVDGLRRHSLDTRTLNLGARTLSKTKSILNAVSFVSELQVATAKQAKRDREQPLTRRVSVGSIVLDKGFSRRTSDLTRWSKSLFASPFQRKVNPSASAMPLPENADLLRDLRKIHPLSFRHDSSQRSFWDVFILLMICIDIVLTPLLLGFDFDPPYAEPLNVVGISVFFVDFVINMLSSYQNARGEVISGPRYTTKHYLLSFWALPDFLSWFPFEYLAITGKGRFLSFAKVIRLAKVSHLARRLHSAKKVGFVRFTRLLGTVFLVSHVLTCYWNWVATEWQRNEVEVMARPLSERYAHIWSLVIGCLNASPPSMYTPAEEVSVAAFMLIGNILQASVFGSVAAVITSFDEAEVAYNKKLVSTYERCKFLGIPEPLSRRIQGFYESLYRETKSVSPDADAFINELSPAMICEVKFQLYRDMLKQIPFLSAQKIDPTVIELLILHLRTVIYMQDDVLIRKGEFGDWMGFIGSKGLVGVLDPRSLTRKIIRVLRKGEYFGEMALLQRAKRSTTAVALTWVQIHVLCRVDLDDVKEQYPSQAQVLEDEINKYMKSKVVYK